MLHSRTLPFKLRINDDICLHCRRCLAAQDCRGRAIITLDPEDGPFIDMGRCQGCLSCMAACPFGAVKKTDYT